MRINDLVVLDNQSKYIYHIFDKIEKYVRDKKVLNVGAAGGVEGYLPMKSEIWLQTKIAAAAAHTVAIDIDQSAIDYAKVHGVEILKHNCETMNLGTKFDVIVLSDVIEHMEAPVTGVRNLMAHLKNDGRLLITTPNPLSFNLIVRAVLGRNVNTFWDHVGCYLPEHIQGICDRHNYELEATYFFDHLDQRSMKIKLKSHCARLISRFNPRLATSCLTVIKHRASK